MLTFPPAVHYQTSVIVSYLRTSCFRSNSGILSMMFNWLYTDNCFVSEAYFNGDIARLSLEERRNRWHTPTIRFAVDDTWFTYPLSSYIMYHIRLQYIDRVAVGSCPVQAARTAPVGRVRNQSNNFFSESNTTVCNQWQRQSSWPTMTRTEVWCDVQKRRKCPMGQVLWLITQPRRLERSGITPDLRIVSNGNIDAHRRWMLQQYTEIVLNNGGVHVCRPYVWLCVYVCVRAL